MANNFFNNSRLLKPGKLARADEVENKFDAVGVGFDDVQVETNRAIKLASGSHEIPDTPATRANQIIGFDASGALQLQPGVGRYRGDWATATAYALRDVVKDAATRNLYICQIAHTSGVLNDDIAAGKFVLLISVVEVEQAKLDAQAAANAAATSETNAATSETNAANSASAAATSETSAATSETNAASSASAAATSATNAAASETNAASSASAAAASETNAASSASAAATSETNASTSATNAASSASAAAASETNAASSASAAATSETNAAGSASAAATSETNAANSATAAATSETNAATSATNADASEAKALKWADEAEDIEVETGKYSALHWSAKASQSAAGVNLPAIAGGDAGKLLKVKVTEDGYEHTSDGAGSGLDADLLDGKDSTAFLEKVGGTMTGPLTVPADAFRYTVNGLKIATEGNEAHTWLPFADGQIYLTANGDMGTGKGLYFRESTAGAFTTILHVTPTTITYNGNTVWHADNDGAGSGLDADLLDGYHGSYYLPAANYTASDVLTKIKTVDGSSSGLDADLLDGNQASAFALLTGATFSGQVTFQNGVRCSQNSLSASTEPGALPSGYSLSVEFFDATSRGWPDSAGQVATYNGSPTSRCVQIFLPNASNTYHSRYIHFRSYNFTGSVWYPWNTINLGTDGIINQETWIEPTLQNGWVNYGIGWAIAGYYKDKQGMVHVKGMLKSGTVGSSYAVFTLPVGYRPAEGLIFTAQNQTSGARRLDMNDNGTVVPHTANNDWVAFYFTFRAA